MINSEYKKREEIPCIMRGDSKMDFKHKNYLKRTDDVMANGKHSINNHSNENP